MKPAIDKMLKVWDKVQSEINGPVPDARIALDELLSSIFAIGPCYYYLIYLQDMRISDVSSGFGDIHGIPPQQVNHIDQIFSLIHPEDVDFVARAEERALLHILEKGMERVTRYKVSYNVRFKVADGTYKLFNHQSLVLSIDQHNNAVKSVNIHTDISHITSKNNYKWSAIGLASEPSYLNLDVDAGGEQDNAKKFSKRELEVMRLIAEGHSTKIIADTLFITPDTVKAHRKNILVKSGCSNMAELAARSISEGWI